jgi:selT/selW/selH-like putative selenoprotein
VKLEGGRRGSFEVSVDGELLHSKLTTAEWPDTDRVLAEIERRLRR